MIFGLHEKVDMSHTVRERICSQAGVKLELCNRTVFASLLRSPQFHNNKNISWGFHLHVPDQTENAVIYVAVVVVFYAAIIIILVGTNIRRRPRHELNPKRVKEFFRKQTVLVYSNEKTKTIKTSHKSLHALPDEGDDTVAPL